MQDSLRARNNIRTSGHGKTAMVFAHGFGCDQNMWRLVAPAFEDEYQVILFDYVGAGKSDIRQYDPVRYSQIDGYALDLIEVCQSQGVEQAIFVGHSVSCMIGLVAALREPALCSRMIMIGPSPKYINSKDYVGGFDQKDIDGLFESMDRNYVAWANVLAPAIMGNEDRPELGSELTQSFCASDPVIARQFATVTFYSDNRADLPRLMIPCLILQCTDDIIAPVAVGRYVAENIARSQFVQLKATGHCPHLSSPVETISAMKNFLSETV